MKRIISFFMIIILMCSINSTVFADNSLEKSVKSEIGNNLLKYMEGDDEDLLITGQNFGYIDFIQKFEKNKFSMALFGLTDTLIHTGNKPDKQKYMEVLVNIIVAYDLDCAADISEQRNMDNLKTFKDYAMDTVKMGEKAVEVMVGSNPVASELESGIATAIDGMGILVDQTDRWIETLSNLETIVQDYSKHDAFLKSIEDNADGDLRDAASTLRQGMKSAIKIKLDSYNDLDNENFKDYEEFFFSNMFFNAVRLTAEYESDDALKFLVDIGDTALSSIGVVTAAWDLGKMIGTMVGDFVVGGENLINRVQEIMALRDISLILQQKISDINSEFHQKIGTDEEEKIVSDYIAFSNYLIGCRIRGEYCLYSSVANDVGLLSWFGKKSAEDAEKWYEENVKAILRIQSKLISVNQIEEIEIIDYLKQCDLLPEKLHMQTADFWQFDGPYSYEIDGFAIEYNETKRFSMRNEDASYIKLYGFALGDSATELETTLKEKKWANYYRGEEYYGYVAIIEDKEYLLEVAKDTDGKISRWYLNNWPDGIEPIEALERLRQYISQDNDKTTKVGYKYAYDEILNKYELSNNYALYDIDKDGTPELIISSSPTSHQVFTYDGNIALNCGQISSYNEGLKEYDGNGMAVYDGGMGSLHFEYVYLYTLENKKLKISKQIISNEESTTEEVRATADSMTAIQFYEISNRGVLQ